MVRCYAAVGAEGVGVCPCSAQVWLIRVLATGLWAAVSDDGESPVWTVELQSADPGPVGCQGHAHVSDGSQAELGLEKVPRSLPHSP